jgi:hypothetical protein
MYAYSKESRPANAFAGRVSKGFPPKWSSLWGEESDKRSDSQPSAPDQHERMAKVAPAVAVVGEAWGGAGAGAVDNVCVCKHRRLHVSCVHTHASTHKNNQALLCSMCARRETHKWWKWTGEGQANKAKEL